MPGYYDPRGRPPRQPSQIEYRQLVQAYQNLQAEYERAMLMVRQQEAALGKQGQRIAQLEAELQRTGALLAQRERGAAGAGAPSTQTAQQLKRAQERASQLEQQLAQAKARIAQLETDLASAREAHAEGRAAELAQQLTQARAQRGQVEQALGQETVRTAELDAQVQDAEARSAQLKRQLQEAAAQISRLEAQLAASRQPQVKAAPDDVDWRDRYLRLQADLDNAKRRQERRFAQAAEEDRQRILRDMLPLADHLELGLKHWESQPHPEAQPAVGAYVDSMRATLRAFLDTLRRYGIERIDAQGQPFDPNLHEGIGHIPSAAVPEGQVADVVQSGYTENGKLLRPARVLVSSGQPADGQ